VGVASRGSTIDTALISSLFADYTFARVIKEGYLQRYASAAYPERSSIAKHPLIDRFRQLVEAHFLTHQTVQAYAEILGITANHLSESAKAATGLPAGALIRQRLLLEAKRLLVHTDQSVQQIAECLSFQDPSYFGRFFKRETGQSPSAFRNTIRRKYHLTQHSSLVN